MKTIYIVIFASTAIVWSFYCIYFGVGDSSDTFLQYSKWADVLIAKNFNISAFIQTVDFHVPPYLYFGFVSLIAFTKIIAGVFWQEAIVIINILLGSFLAVILANLIYLFTKNKIASCIIMPFYILNPEIVLWSRFVLSDILYMFINFFMFYLIVKLFLKDENGVRCIFGSILALFLSCIFRPIGFIMIPVIAFAFFLKISKKEIQWRYFFFWFVFLALVLIFLHSVFIKDSSFWPFEFGKDYWQGRVVIDYHNGVLINNRPHMNHPAPCTIGDYILITLDKFAHYFYFLDSTFKFYHTIINYLYFPLLYFLFILGIIGASVRTIAPNMRSLIALSVIVIITFGLFHSMTCIDHDWRFRLPIFPYLVFVAGIGLDFLMRSFVNRGFIDSFPNNVENNPGFKKGSK